MPYERIQTLDDRSLGAIMRAAIEEFSQASYGHASYNRIIAKAGFSKGRMYYYFASKEDLYESLLTAAIRRFQLVIGVVSQPKEALVYWAITADLLRKWHEFAQAEPPKAQLLVMAFADPRSLELSPAAIYAKKLVAWVESWISLGQSLGCVREDLDATSLATAVHLEWGGLALLHESRRISTPMFKRLAQDLIERSLACE